MGMGEYMDTQAIWDAGPPRGAETYGIGRKSSLHLNLTLTLADFDPKPVKIPYAGKERK